MPGQAAILTLVEAFLAVPDRALAEVLCHRRPFVDKEEVESPHVRLVPAGLLPIAEDVDPFGYVAVGAFLAEQAKRSSAFAFVATTIGAPNTMIAVSALRTSVSRYIHLSSMSLATPTNPTSTG